MKLSSCIFIMLSFVAANGQPSLHTTRPFPHAPGIFMEGMPEVRIIFKRWTIATSINLQDVYRHTEPLEPVIQRFQSACSNLTRHCKLDTSADSCWPQGDAEAKAQWNQIKNNLKPLSSDNDQSHTSFSTSLSRAEKELLTRAIPKSTQRSTSDAVYQSYYVVSEITNMISNLDKGQAQASNLFQLLSNGSQPFSDFQILNNNFTRLMKEISYNRTKLLTSLFDVITYTQLGLTHPDSFQEDQLSMAVQTINNSYSDVYIPLPKRETGINQLARIGTLKFTIRKGVIMILLDVPLVRNIVQERLFKLHSHPVLQTLPNNRTVFAYVKPTSDYLLLINYSTYFALLSRTDLDDKCKNLKEFYLCTLPTLHDIHRVELPCEMQLMNSSMKAPYKACDIRLLPATQDYWTPLARPSNWLYSLTQASKAQVTCPHYPTYNVLFNKTGLTQLEPGCTLKTDYAILVSNPLIDPTFYTPDYFPKVNLNLTSLFPGLFNSNIQFPFRTNLHEFSVADIIKNLTKPAYYNTTHAHIHDLSMFWKTLVMLLLCIMLITFSYIAVQKYTHSRTDLDDIPSHIFAEDAREVSPEPTYAAPNRCIVPGHPLSFAFASTSRQEPERASVALLDSNRVHYSLPRHPPRPVSTLRGPL